MWNQVNDAIFEIYDGTTIQDLLNKEKRIKRKMLKSNQRPPAELGV
jgi:DNA-binding IscR family transcriptional regulator